jgi:hypothetical protein
MQESKVHFPRVLPARYVPPPGFGYPPGGLLPSVPGRFCFTPAALLGFTLRSQPSTRYPGVSTRMHPPTVRPDVVPDRRSDRPARQAAVSGFRPWRRPRSRPKLGLAARPPDAPLGFPLSGFFATTLTGISPDLLSRSWLDTTLTTSARLCLRVSISPRFACLTRHGKPHRWTDNPLRVFAPARSWHSGDL